MSIGTLESDSLPKMDTHCDTIIIQFCDDLWSVHLGYIYAWLSVNAAYWDKFVLDSLIGKIIFHTISRYGNCLIYIQTT